MRYLNRTAVVQAQNAGNNFGAFALLHLPYRAFAHRFQCLVIQPARIIFSHAASESHSPCTVKKNIDLLMN